MPSNELLRALGRRHRFDPARGYLITETNDDGLTSVANVYAAGATAVCSLRLAVSAELEHVLASVHARRRRYRRIQAGLWKLFEAPRSLAELTYPDTIICRCEDVIRSQVATAFDQNAQSTGSAKCATRAGMGRCQRRYCGPLLAALAASYRRAAIDEASHWAPRPPVKPLYSVDII